MDVDGAAASGLSPPPPMGPSSSSALAPSRAFKDVMFADLCELFEAIRGVNCTGKKGTERKRRLLDSFHAKFCIVHGPRTGAYDLYRLILPTVDKDRAAYNLKEAALARCLGLALGLKRGKSPDFDKLEGWRKDGKGNFAQTVYEVCALHRPRNLGDVRRATVGDVNTALDRLSEGGKATEKVPILVTLVDAMDAGQIRWLVAIIIKDLKLGYGETAIMRHFHPDAEDLYNVCCDLKRVCRELHTRDVPWKRQELQPGSLVKAMVASRAHGCAQAFKHMARRDFVIETKFDGERIQVHRVGPNQFHYFTRNNFDFGPRGYDVLNRLFTRRLARDRCVLDGELVIWDKVKQRFAAFGYIKSLIKAANDGVTGERRCVDNDKAAANKGVGGKPVRARDQDDDDDDDDDNDDDDDDDNNEYDDNNGGGAGDKGGGASHPTRDSDDGEDGGGGYIKDLEIVYVAFDVLYDQDHSVINRPLSDRHEVLRNMFKPLPRAGTGMGPKAGAVSGAGPGGGGRIGDEERGGERLHRRRAGGSGDGHGNDSDDGNASDDDGFVEPSDGSVPIGPVGGVVRGRVQLNLPRLSDDLPENPHCVVGLSEKHIEDMLQEKINRQEEGLVIKDLSSKWVPSERGNRWVKLKPDYLPNEDLDCVLIGGFYGTGKHGGKIAEYLLGIVEAPPEGSPPGTKPTHVMSFAKVGIGINMKDLEALRDTLDRHMVPAGKRHKPPSCYKVTGAAGETPDVWISHPGKSVVVTVKADIRLVRTATFWSPYSLRFPRVTSVRWDKPWDEILSDRGLNELVERDGGIAVNMGDGAGKRGVDGSDVGRPRSKFAKVAAQRDRRQPGHLAAVTTGDVERRGDSLKALDVTVIAGGGGAGGRASDQSAALKLELAILVKAHGGSYSELRHKDVTHVIAAPEARNTASFQAHPDSIFGGLDILTPNWLRECAAAGRVIDPRPRHQLYLARSTVEAAGGGMDRFGDQHSVDVNVEDVAALLRGELVKKALESVLGRAAAEAGVDAVRREAAAAAAGDAEVVAGALKIFSGCVFLVVAMPADLLEGGRVRELEAGGGGGGGEGGTDATATASVGVAESSAAAAAATVVPGMAPTGCSCPAAMLIVRSAAARTVETAAAISMGEARRMARGVELSLRLRGGMIARRPGGNVTHVVAVTPTPAFNPGTAAAADVVAEAEEDVEVAPVSERALAFALRAMAPPSPPPPRSEYAITTAWIAGDSTTRLSSPTGSAGAGERGELYGGGMLPPSVRVVSPRWVLARIAAGRPVV